MKLTENEPTERTFTLKLSETELRVLVVATELTDFTEASDRTRIPRETIIGVLNAVHQAARLLGVRT